MPTLQRDDYEYAYINALTTTQVSAAPGIVHRLIVGSTLVGAITIVDNTTGSTPVLASLQAGTPIGSYTLNLKASNGIRVITEGTPSLTIAYRS